MDPLKGRMDFEFETMRQEFVKRIEEKINVEVAQAREAGGPAQEQMFAIELDAVAGEEEEQQVAGAEAARSTLATLAAEAGIPFSGVLCGRATWQDGIPVYATKGFEALVEWLEDRGVKNINALNTLLAQGAKPWWDFYGGKKKIQVVENPYQIPSPSSRPRA